jgi:hypothetical protein
MKLIEVITTATREYLNEEINNQTLIVNENGNIVVNGVEFISDKIYGTVRRDNSQNTLQGLVYNHLYSVLKKCIINGMGKNEILYNLSKVTRSSEMVIETFLDYIGLNNYQITEENLKQTDLWYHGTDLIFDNPKFINSGREIGFHLGSREQALNIKNKIKNNYPKYINKYKIINIKPLRVRDLKFWLPEYIADELINKGFDVKKTGKGYLGSTFYKPDDILDTLNANGFDSIIYNNEYEGDGDSIIVFDNKQIKFAGREKIKQKDYNHKT